MTLRYEDKHCFAKKKKEIQYYALYDFFLKPVSNGSKLEKVNEIQQCVEYCDFWYS